MILKINNIEFSFKNQGSDLMSDNDNLGLGHLIIPGPMCKRFAKECGDGLIPHYDREQTDDVRGLSEHECYNSDTQIVLMNYLFNKKRKYKLEYYGLDPFWICHDSFHAQHDVYGGEVQGIRSGIELERLFQGAERAKELKIGMTADTLIKLQANWKLRWRMWEGDRTTPFKMWEFYKYLRNDEEREIAEWYSDNPSVYKTPTSRQTTLYPL